MSPSIDLLKQRLDAINRLRMGRALAAGSPAFQQVYQLLPLLLHYHHPRLPGYLTGEIPQGICLFQATPLQQRLMHRAVMPIPPLQLLRHGPLAIAALYSMGSSASLGQTSASDLDLWICLQPGVSATARRALQQKCQLLSAWSQQQGVTTHFFIMDEYRFRKQPKLYDQLLLEEFYRTQVRLAGKRLLWPIIPVEQEPYYEESLTRLYQQGVVDQQQWLDLGSLKRPAATHYFGAARCQLANNLLSPYKVVLKNLLLEIYAASKSPSPWLALTFKRQFQQGDWGSFGLDPYCMVLDHITHYVTKRGDPRRLERVRRCFYLKVRDQSSCPITGSGWRQAILRKLMIQWGWEVTRTPLFKERLDEQLADPEAYPADLQQEIKQNFYHLRQAAPFKYHHVLEAAEYTRLGSPLESEGSLLY